MEKEEKKKWKPDYVKMAIFAIIIILLIIMLVITLGRKRTDEKNIVETAALQNLYNQQELEEIVGENELDISNTEEPAIVVQENNKPEETTTVTEHATTTTSAGQNGIPYYIKVNYAQNVVTIYQKDEDGNYTVPIKAMVCSTGVATPTSGVYTTSDKYTWGTLVGGVHGQYCTRIVKSILFHSVPYTVKYDNSSLEYWEYDKLGTSASAGCVRLTVQDAKWIFNNCAAGTKVEFYADSNPGPLGKPSAQKISSEEELRGWDPTDPAEGNPWRNIKIEEPEQVQEQAETEKPTEIVEENKEKIENETKIEEQSNQISNTVTNEIIIENNTTNNIQSDNTDIILNVQNNVTI